MTFKRKPQKTPGEAVLQEEDIYLDLHLCPSLYYDAVFFLFQAKKRDLDEDVRNRNKRAALLTSFSFFEAFLNQIAFGHAAAHKIKLSDFELDVLEERTSILDRGDIVRKEKFYNMEDRFLFVYRFLTGKDFKKNSKLWSDFKKVRKLRNEWTHPKPPLQAYSLTLKDVELTIKTIYSIFTTITNEMNIENPLWLIDYKAVIKKYKEEKWS